MKIVGMEVMMQGEHRVKGFFLLRLGTVPINIDTDMLNDLSLKIQIKPPTGGVQEFFLSLNELRMIRSDNA